MLPPLPRKVKVYIAGWVGLALLAIVGLWQPIAWPSPWFVPLLFVGADFVARLKSIPMPGGNAISLSFPIIYAALLIWNKETAVVVMVISTLLQLLVLAWQAFRINTTNSKPRLAFLAQVRGWPFNVANQTTCMLAVGWVIERCTSPTFRDFSLAMTIVVVGLAVGVALVNTLAISYATLLVGRTGRAVSMKSAWTYQYAPIIPQYVITAFLALLIVGLYKWAPWRLIYLIPAVIVFYNAMVGYSRHFFLTQQLISKLGDIIEADDYPTGGHVSRVAMWSEKLAKEMGLPLAETKKVILAALVHDLGKITIPDSVLRKPGFLTPEERSVMQGHVKPEVMAKLLGNLPYFEEIKALAESHHEKWDGTGYTQGLKAEAIPLISRILAAVDVYEALTAVDRPYKKAMPPWKAAAILKKDAGSHFDPTVVSVFLGILAREHPLTVLADWLSAMITPVEILAGKTPIPAWQAGVVLSFDPAAFFGLNSIPFPKRN